LDRSGLSFDIYVLLFTEIREAFGLLQFRCTRKPLFDLSHVGNSLVLSYLKPVFSVLHFKFKLVLHVFHELFSLV